MMIKGKEVKKVHFTGIGGIGMSALAQMMLDHGVTVTGSDRDESPVTELIEGKGIKVLIPQVAENVPDDIDALIYSDAVPTTNPEREIAERKLIPQMSYFEAVGGVFKGKRTVAIAGTHGKTTTTGMIARVLKDAGESPTAIIGSLVKDFGSNYLPGTSDLFVVESCEYKRHFLNIAPEMLVITNVEFDHTDYFRDLVDVQDAFRTLIERVPEHGAIVTDATHPNIAPLLLNTKARIIDYTKESSFELRLPGELNKMNARAAAGRRALSLATSPTTSFPLRSPISTEPGVVLNTKVRRPTARPSTTTMRITPPRSRQHLLNSRSARRVRFLSRSIHTSIAAHATCSKDLALLSRTLTMFSLRPSMPRAKSMMARFLPKSSPNGLSQMERMRPLCRFFCHRGSARCCRSRWRHHDHGRGRHL